MLIATTKLKPVKCITTKHTGITTSIPLVTHYRIAVSMTLKSEDKKKKKQNQMLSNPSRDTSQGN